MAGIFNNWKVVSLSLIGATTFWFFNALNKNYDTNISYPVEFDFNRDSVVVMKSLPGTLDINVSSGGWNLLRKTFWFNVNPIHIQLDNPTEIAYYTGNALLPIVTEQLSDLKINSLLTDTVFIDIELKEHKKVKAVIDSMRIDLAEDHRLTSKIFISPDSILLTGPKSFIDTLDDFYVVRLPTKGINSDYDRKVEVALPNPKRIKSDPEKVEIKFSVDKFNRHSVQVPVDAQNFPSDSTFYLSRSTVQVFYTIAESDDEDFKPSDFAITADRMMMNRKDSTVIAILVLFPQNVLDVEVIPENIKVTYARRKH